MPFQEEIAALNQSYFFSEFTYSNSRFRYRTANNTESEVELADNLLWIGNDLIIYQLKERFAPTPTTPEQERAWYDGKVLRKGTKQIRDTLEYLRSQETISLENHRNHQFDLDTSSISTIHKLVVFKPDPELPIELVAKKYHESSTAGIIHMIYAEDYKGIIRTLLTPAEFMDYLAYREGLIARWGDHVNTIPEQALVGHYMAGDEDDRPEIYHAFVLEDIDHRIEQWDISGIIRLYAERIIDTQSPTDYYPIVTSLAQLKRNELEQFKQRFLLSMDKARANEFVIPYRVAYPRVDCGFVFIPLTEEAIPHQANAIKNYTLAHKYDQRLQKCIGMTFAPVEGGQYDVGWCFIEYTWEYEQELADRIANNYPFRDVITVQSDRYSVREDLGD